MRVSDLTFLAEMCLVVFMWWALISRWEYSAMNFICATIVVGWTMELIGRFPTEGPKDRR